MFNDVGFDVVGTHAHGRKHVGAKFSCSSIAVRRRGVTETHSNAHEIRSSRSIDIHVCVIVHKNTFPVIVYRALPKHEAYDKSTSSNTETECVIRFGHDVGQTEARVSVLQYVFGSSWSPRVERPQTPLTASQKIVQQIPVNG